LAGDDPLRIETRSDVDCQLLNWVVFDWRVYIAILHQEAKLLYLWAIYVT
jgi:hypothetical protein